MQTNEELEDFMAKTAWTLDKKYHKAEEVKTPENCRDHKVLYENFIQPYKASYDCFKRAVDDPSILEELDITEEQRETLLKTIKQVCRTSIYFGTPSLLEILIIFLAIDSSSTKIEV